MSKEKGRLTTADYLPIEEFDRLVDGLHRDGLQGFKVRYRLPIKAFSTHTFRKTFGRYVYAINAMLAATAYSFKKAIRALW